MVNVKRSGPLRRKTPLRNGTGALRQRKPLNPISDKRRKRMQAARKWKKGDCEIGHLLEGVRAWEGFRDAFSSRPDLWAIRDRHHVWGQPGACDEEWNVVTVCRPAHEFEDQCWQQAGAVVCMVALDVRGEFQPERVFKRIGVRPIGLLSNWMEDGLFDREPVLAAHAMSLLRKYSTFIDPI